MSTIRSALSTCLDKDSHPPSSGLQRSNCLRSVVRGCRGCLAGLVGSPLMREACVSHRKRCWSSSLCLIRLLGGRASCAIRSDVSVQNSFQDIRAMACKPVGKLLPHYFSRQASSVRGHVRKIAQARALAITENDSRRTSSDVFVVHGESDLYEVAPSGSKYLERIDANGRLTKARFEAITRPVDFWIFEVRKGIEQLPDTRIEVGSCNSRKRWKVRCVQSSNS